MVRAARPWLLWLSLALAAAHSVATWHAYTHSPAEANQASSDEKHAGTALCGACIAAAGIGGAAHANALPSLPAVSGPAPVPTLAVVDRELAQRRPYAIRAPPVFHS